MMWAVSDPRNQQDLVLAMPRQKPADAPALTLWQQAARKSARIDHPGLAHAVEVGEVEGWPYVTYDPGSSSTMGELTGSKGMSAAELVPRALQALQGLAFAHEAGVAHGDLQTSMLLVSESGACRLLGLGVALAAQDPRLPPSGSLQLHRLTAERDVLAFGLVMHQLLSGQPALEEPDVGRVIGRMPPLGREPVRLPWSMPHPVPEALRAIINRATDRQERQRYRNARTLVHALEGWLSSEGGGAGPLAQLQDRIRAAGVLPAVPGGASRAARLAMMERERTIELAEIVLQDTALTFELLRTVNSSQVRGVLGSGSGPVLTIRRTIAMIGLDGVRQAALSLRAWPGPLDDSQAAELERLFDRVRRAGRIAQWLRPAGYDAEVVYLLALLQNLGRLIVQYHFPDESAQIRRLMQPEPATKAGEPDEPGMSEQAASYAVLGIDLEAIAAGVARQWGLDDAVMHMIRRPAPGAPVRSADTDDEVLRLSAACANEVVDAQALPPAQMLAALQRVAQRYARVLGVTLREVQLAAQGIEPSSVQTEGERSTQFGGLQ
ncbi:MAG: HDOD domain-containing protein [Burkholderiaceae bacterium]|nr:HDOD domain-containing protein [Burkholderiaceae bacterium]